MTKQEYITRLYHQLFSYTLSHDEVRRWKAGSYLRLKKGFKKENIKTTVSLWQKENKKFSQKKLIIARKAASLLEKIPFVLFVGISGSLAMNNAKEESDIDFMVITRANTLWLSRALSLLLLPLTKNTTRKAGTKDEKDKLCLNLWIDENSLQLPLMPKTAYTAHEVAQVIPLVNKNKTYERWLYKNKWVENYWPNAVSIHMVEILTVSSNVFIYVLNSVAYALQRLYMQRKITREHVSLHYAYFHPYDWGDRIIKRLREKGIVEHVE